jgi:uncharacterized protein (DUF488 family)
MNLYTLGYEGLDLTSFIARLKRAGVRQVVDVRELPLSRKKGFSKNGLASALQARGIPYTHMAALGCPKPIRNRYKHNGDWNSYRQDFLAHLKTQADTVLSVARLAREKAICLICFEADFEHCHRSLVARAAVARGAPSVIHLTVETGSADVRLRAAA